MKIWVKILICAVIVAIVVGCAYVLFRNNKHAANVTTPTPTVAAEELVEEVNSEPEVAAEVTEEPIATDSTSNVG